MTALFVGVDGGGSRTRVLVADAEGLALATADGEGCAVRPGQASHSATVIADLVRSALAATDRTPDRTPDRTAVRALCVGVAGVGRAEEREALALELEREQLAEELVVVPDFQIALEDAFGDAPGILLSAGTGSIACGRGPTGSVARCGGWGPVCGDEGSGAWIGRRALGVVTASHDGREPETSLTAPVLAATGSSDARELVAWAAQATPADLARLAPTVMEVAATGDLRANSLLTMAIEELGLHVRTLARQLFGDERAAFNLVLHGGLLSRGSLVRKRLEQRLKSMTPGAQVRQADIQGERGAVRLAMRHTRVRTAYSPDA